MTNKIEFTKEANKQILKIISEQGENSYFRISVQGGVVLALNTIFHLMEKLLMMILFLIKQL